MSNLLSGKEVAAAMNARLLARSEALKARGIAPKLAIVRCGENPSDLSYERGAMARSALTGVAVDVIALPEDVAKDALIDRIRALNADASVHGVLLFRPLPKHLRAFDREICNALEPAKDVDAIGYHPFYNPKPGSLLNYWRDIEAFRAWLGRQGFSGTLHASEWNINGRATSVDPKDARDCWCGTYTQSETAKAKEVLQQMVRHAGYGIPSCFCEMSASALAEATA